MSAARSVALLKALTDHQIGDPGEWIAWVRTTPTLTDEERDLVLAADSDDLAAAGDLLAAEVDHRAAMARAAGELMAGLARFYESEADTLAEMLGRARAEDPGEHRRLVALTAVAFPTTEVPR